jgi:hypothetical protein
MDSHNQESRMHGDAVEGRVLCGPMTDAAAEAWRRERLYLYLFWLEHRDKSPFNFVGGWHTADIGDEVKRWKRALRGLDNDAALELVDRELALRFSKPWHDALLEGASPMLAAAHLPVWNAATAALLPAHLGPLSIFRAESYPGRPALGWSYNYGRPGSNEKLSLTLYHGGETGLRDRLDDPRLQDQVFAAWLDVAKKVRISGGVLEGPTTTQPTTEVLLDRYNREVGLLAVHGHGADSDQVARFEAVCMCVFRAHFLKVRYTRRAASGPTDIVSGLAAVKSDLADFIASFA